MFKNVRRVVVAVLTPGILASATALCAEPNVADQDLSLYRYVLHATQRYAHDEYCIRIPSRLATERVHIEMPSATLEEALRLPDTSRAKIRVPSGLGLACLAAIYHGVILAEVFAAAPLLATQDRQQIERAFEEDPNLNPDDIARLRATHISAIKELVEAIYPENGKELNSRKEFTEFLGSMQPHVLSAVAMQTQRHQEILRGYQRRNRAR